MSLHTETQDWLWQVVHAF